MSGIVDEAVVRPAADAPGVVLGLVGHDIHVVANRLLEVGMAENGFRPYNIGTNNTVDDFTDAVLETGACAVLVASVNGEGEKSCEGFGARFVERGLSHVLLYVGGNLVIDSHRSAEMDSVFASYGFHRAFHRPPSFQAVFDTLWKDLGRGSS